MATVNNNWPTPVQTDLVKDGWEAIKDLGDAIDTTLGVYADPGLVLLNTSSFTGVSAINLTTNTFSATYDNYRILMSVTGSTTAVINVRMRLAGVDNSSAVYNHQRVDGDGATAAAVQVTSQTSGRIGVAFTTPSSFTIDCYSPFLVASTLLTSVNNEKNALLLSTETVAHVANTSYDSLSFIPASGTITGTVSVYGYNK